MFAMISYRETSRPRHFFSLCTTVYFSRLCRHNIAFFFVLSLFIAHKKLFEAAVSVGVVCSESWFVFFPRRNVCGGWVNARERGPRLHVTAFGRRNGYEGKCVMNDTLFFVAEGHIRRWRVTRIVGSQMKLLWKEEETFFCGSSFVTCY